MATWPTVTDDDGTGTTGTILDQALFNSVRDYIGAAWSDVAFSAGNFTGSGTITWTVASGDQGVFRYVEIGKTMFVTVQLNTTTVSGTGSDLRLTVPNGRTIGGGAYQGAARILDNGTADEGWWYAAGGLTYIAFKRNITGSNWSASTNNTYIYASCQFEIA